MTNWILAVGIMKNAFLSMGRKGGEVFAQRIDNQ